MFEDINLSKLHNNEFVNLGDQIFTILEKYLVAIPALAAEKSKLKNVFEPVNAHFAYDKASPLSMAIGLADERRDDAILGIKAVAGGYRRHFDAPMKEAAVTILRAIEKYEISGGGNIAEQNYNAESASLIGLSADFNAAGPIKDAMAKLGLTAWGAEMDAANKEFDVLYLKRNEQSGQKPAGTFKDARNAAKKQILEFLTYVNSVRIAIPGADITNLFNELNALIGTYNRLLATRAGKAAPTPPTA